MIDDVAAMADAKRQRRDRGPKTSPPLAVCTASLKGKRVLVTGGTSGLGAEIARCAVLAQAAAVVITGREADRGAAVKSELVDLDFEFEGRNQRRQKVEFKQADLANPQECADVFEFAKSFMGHVDCLVNCAAICKPRHSPATSHLRGSECM